jgi:hypothetical protein
MRMAPEKPAPVIKDGVRYEAPVPVDLRAGGKVVVEAWDEKTNRKLWTQLVYVMKPDNPGLEFDGDVIEALSLDGDALLITSSGQIQKKYYRLDLKTRKVEALRNPWRKLFADEKWYKDEKGEEQVFNGKLEKIPDAGGASALMRTSFYKLGERTVYTGGKRNRALDALLGRAVEIRGKAVEMELEGRKLREIWPATVRKAGADAAVPGAPDEAAARRLMLKWIKDNNREADWGVPPITVEEIQVRPDPNLPHLWQAYVVFKKGGSFGLHIEKATGRILLPVD